jgi:hypothetical protein
VKKINLIIALTISLFITLSNFAQDDKQNKSKCDCKECHQFDFWFGKWKVEWQNDDGTNGEGTNIINSILNGCVIEENFDGNPGIAFRGKSFSVYNHKKEIWQQTWVDTEGNYMVFTGGMQKDKMILFRNITYEGKEITQRMVFYCISENSIDWNWESSTDNGENWKLNWELKYTRK